MAAVYHLSMVTLIGTNGHEHRMHANPYSKHMQAYY